MIISWLILFAVDQVTYETTGEVQMTFLRLLHEDGYQNFTYTCINSVAWLNHASNSYELALKLLGNNDFEFSYDTVRPNIIVDGCKVFLFIVNYKQHLLVY